MIPRDYGRRYSCALPTLHFQMTTEAERAIESEEEFLDWCLLNHADPDDYADNLREERGLLYDGPVWEEC